MSTEKLCVVAVGSTEFEQLIDRLTYDYSFYELLIKHQFTRLVYQIGKGFQEPKEQTIDCLKIETYRNIMLEPLIKQSHLVISHCGAGILLESLRSNLDINKDTKTYQTKCVAVVNDTLMGNHQSELADALESEGYISKAVPSNVLE